MNNEFNFKNLSQVQVIKDQCGRFYFFRNKD